MPRLSVIVLLVLTGLLPGLAAAEAGFRQITLDPQSERPLEVALWYPTDAHGPTEMVGDNAAFYGIEARRDAVPEAGTHPLVLLSHGYGGSWRSLNWLAEELVEAGYVVAAPDHPGTTTFNRNPEQAADSAERPRDLSRVADALLADAALAGLVDPERIAAIGHSLGGWTVAAFAGARFDPEQFAADCVLNPQLRACALAQELGLGSEAIAAPLRDPRIRAFITLDLGLARGFTAASLSAIETPALVIGAGVDVGDMPVELETGWLGKHLSPDHARVRIVPDAMHFSFMGLCKPGAEALIEDEVPGEGIICRDGGTRSRQEIHAEVGNEILTFLAASLQIR